MRTLLFIVALLTLLAGLIFLFPNGCTKPEDTKRILTAHGYSQIEITGYRPFMASKDDVFSTGFRAKSPNGTIVTGAVTSAPFKGSTIRLD